MRVVGADVDLELGQLLPGEAVPGQHALDGLAEHLGRLAVELLPAQSLAVSGRLTYDLVIADVGCYHVTIDARRARVVKRRYPRSRIEVDFRIETFTNFLAEIDKTAKAVNPAIKTIPEIYPGIEGESTRVGVDVYSLYPVVDMLAAARQRAVVDTGFVPLLGQFDSFQEHLHRFRDVLGTSTEIHTMAYRVVAFAFLACLAFGALARPACPEPGSFMASSHGVVPQLPPCGEAP